VSSDRMCIGLVVIMPVYEDRESASQLVAELARTLLPPPMVIVVEDGSRTPMRVAELTQAGVQGAIIHLARNLGHQRAIATGLSYVAAHYEPSSVVVMDSDGEDVPSAIPSLLARLDGGDGDVVVAKRRQRSESWRFRAFYTVYRRLFRILTGRKIRFGNFMALSAGAVRRLAAMQETWVHFPASVIISKLKLAAVPTDRGMRYAGQSQMNMVSLCLHGMRSMMVFAEDVLTRVALFSVLVICSDIVMLVAAMILKLIGWATPGWFSTALGILVIILLQAGILSFVTLMIAGVVRSAAPVRSTELDAIIDRVEFTPGAVRPIGPPDR
jgi:hypothetical protein